MFKFGEKVQMVKMDPDIYQCNIEDETNPLSFEYSVSMGDIGVVITTANNDNDWIEVAFQYGDSNDIIAVDPKSLMIYSDQSEIVFLNNLIELQTKYPVRQYDSLDFKINFDKKYVIAGCQEISKNDAIQIAKDILQYYEVNQL